MPNPDASASAGPAGRLLGPATAGMAMVCVAIVLGVHAESPFTLVSAHGLLHSAIAEQFLSAPGVYPPQNPFFAGEPLAYYWSFHVIVAWLANGLGIDVLRAMELWVAVAIAALVVFSAGLGRAVYGRVGVGLVVAFLVLAGAHAQAPIVLAWKFFSVGAFPVDDGTYLWGLVHPASGWMRLGDPFGQLGPLINYYLNTTSRPLALTTLVGVMWALSAVLGGARKAWLGLLLGMLLLSLWSPLIAIAGGLSLVGAIVVVDIAQRFELPWVSTSPRLRGIPACVGIVGGIGLGLPSYAHMLGGSGGPGNGLLGGGLSTALEHGIGAVASAGVLVGLGCLGLWRAPVARRAELAVPTIAALPLLLATAAIVLPAGNYVNFQHAALVLLALPAAGAIRSSDGAVSRPLLAGVVLLFLPTLLLVLWTYSGRPATEVGSRDGHLVQLGGPRAEIYDWLRERSPLDAVVVIDPGPPTRASQGNTAELPALSSRVLWTERAHHYIVSPYPDASARVEIAERLSAGMSLSDEQQERLLSLARPVFVLVEGSPGEAAAERWGPRVAGSEALGLFRWKPVQNASGAR